MNPAQLSPEECHRLAKERAAQGDYAVAAQLLQVAILKAPGDPTFSAALEKLRADRMQQARSERAAARPLPKRAVSPETSDDDMLRAEITALQDLVTRFPDEPEHLLRLSCHLDALGAGQQALAFARQAIDLAPDALEGHLLAGVIHKKLKNLAAAERARRDVQLISGGHLGEVRAARARLKQMGLKEAPAIALLPTGVQWRRAGLLAVLLLVTAGSWLLARPQTPLVIDAAPFIALEAVAEAHERAGVAEVILTLQAAAWDGMSIQARRDRLLSLFAVASDLGYRRVHVNDGAGRMVGIAESDKIYLRQTQDGEDAVVTELRLTPPPAAEAPPATAVAAPPIGVAAPAAAEAVDRALSSLPH